MSKFQLIHGSKRKAYVTRVMYTFIAHRHEFDRFWLVIDWYVDFFIVLLHSPNGRQMPAVRDLQRNCHWGSKKKRGNSHWSHEPMMQWDTRKSQSIFRPTDHKRMMPASWWTCLLPPGSYPTDSHIATRLRLCSSLIDMMMVYFHFH